MEFNKEPNWPFEAADLVIDIYRASDQGGFVRAPDYGVKIVHKPSGLVAVHEKERSRHRNKIEAMKKLAVKVRLWQAAGEPLQWEEPSAAPADRDAIRNEALDDAAAICFKSSNDYMSHDDLGAAIMRLKGKSMERAADAKGGAA